MRRLISKSMPFLMKGKQYFSEINKFQHNFLSTTNLAYIQSLYQRWTQDKASVSPSFNAYFELLDQGVDPTEAYQQPGSSSLNLANTSESLKEIGKHLKLRLMIEAYRSIGHQFAKTDPLDLAPNKSLYGRLSQQSLQLSSFGFKADQINEQIRIERVEGSKKQVKGPYPIHEVQDYLQSIYCDKIGFQYMHLISKEQRDFIKLQLQQKLESLQKIELTKQEQLVTLKRLAKDQAFIDILNTKFANYKRFGIEGLNSGTTALEQLVESAALSGVENIQFGMAHRGRLNALHCVFDKPAQLIFKQFLQIKNEQSKGTYSGDVKYHMGYIHKKKIGNNEVTLSIIPNPSHLEAVNPLVYGSTRAIQQEGKSKQKVLGVLIHGDAAVAGQGVVWQSLGFIDLVDYSPGGIIHIVLNNQIGFTTNPHQSRSSYYCTEVAKAVDAPVIHVNSDQPDILDKCMKIAVAYRQKFKKDIFIDIIGYRRYGHNQQDQPNFTQPKMYQVIKNKANVFETYSNKLIKNGIIDLKSVQQMKNQFYHQYQEDYKKVISNNFDSYTKQTLPISQIRLPTMWGKSSGVPINILSELFNKITKWPSDFHLHPTIRKIYDQRIRCYTHKEPLDWATMQSLAWASVLYEGYGVRVSGEDVGRGTFSHRHAFISDQQRDVEKYCFLKSISNNVTIANSHLSEFGVLGYEYGYSITNPNTLVIWQAQFGDFCNGAAVIIDNFIVSGQSKWQQPSGIVLSLPHGMDGQGPEHSQGRIERFLHNSDDNCDEEQKQSFEQQMKNCNIQVIACSTTSNYFHALRRQIHRDYRKPLIAFNSKKLLKFKGANSSVQTISQGTNFVPVYGDDTVNPSKVKKVFFCNGQFYYDVKAKRDQLKREDVAIIRIQQLAPYPHEAVKAAISNYGKDVEYSWLQEEHENYGIWNYIHPRLKLSVGNKKIRFFGRPPSASTAVGALKLHKQQEQILLKSIFA